MTASSLPEKLASPLCPDNAALLRQGAEVVASLSRADYTAPDPRCFGASIGGHGRHCVEFYRCLLTGLETGHVDYDARPRDAVLETDAAAACSAMHSLAASIEVLPPALQDGLSLHVLENHDGIQPSWSASSAGRELRFLLSHTVHHYALIGILMQLRGLPIPAGFGVAPSTLRHRATLNSASACAL